MPATDTFEHIIRHQGVPDLVPFLVQLAKEDVVPLRERVLALDKELSELRELEPNTWGSRDTPEQRVMLYLTGFKTYSRKEALSRRFGLWQLAAEYREAFWTVLENARPAWLTDWLAEWQTRLTRANTWSSLPYALLGAEPWLTAQSVAHLLVQYNWRRSTGKQPDIEAYDQLILADLRADATLLTRDIPLLFDFDTMVDAAGRHLVG